MTKKAPKDETKSKSGIQVNRNRGGGKKKPDLFARLRDTGHPLDNIIPIELDFQPGESLDANPSAFLDAQPNNELDTQESKRSDVQQNNQLTPSDKQTGRQNTNILDAQEIKNRTSNQTKTGRQNTKPLDAKTSRKKDWTSSESNNLDVKTSKSKTLDAQPSKKNENWRNWERARSTDRVSLRPSSDILRKFKVFCAEKGLGLTEFFEIAGLKFIELDVQSDRQLDVLTPLDDRRLKMLYKTKPIIINLYLRYNAIFNELAESGGKKWTARWSPRDDESAHRYNDILPAIVELGILQTQVQKGFGSSRIQTFKYYTDEIEKVLASGVSDEMLDTILKYHRQLWKNQTGREVDLEFLEDKS